MAQISPLSSTFENIDFRNQQNNNDQLEAWKNNGSSKYKKKCTMLMVPNFLINWTKEDLVESNDFINSEQLKHEEIANNRYQRYKAIIFNEPLEFSWFKLIFFTTEITLFGFLCSLPLTLLPYHDLMDFPEKWYELLFPATICMILSFVFKLLTVSSWMNIKYILNTRSILYICFAGLTYALVLLIGSYSIWTLVYAYTYPIPMFFFAFVTTGDVLVFMLIWLLFPKSFRQNRKLRKRMLQVTLLMGFILFTSFFGYNFVILLIAISSEQYQPLACLGMIGLREVFIRLACKMLPRAINGDMKGALITLCYAINVNHAISLCAVLGSIATITTSWVLIGIDYSMNLYHCLKLVYKKKQNNRSTHELCEDLEDLALVELAEFQAPLAFTLVFIAAYYGPNSHLMGNIGNSYWGYIAIGDVEQALTNMVILFLVDFSSCISSAVILWATCEINLWKAFYELQAEFDKLWFCICLGFLLQAVNNKFLLI